MTTLADSTRRLLKAIRRILLLLLVVVIFAAGYAFRSAVHRHQAAPSRAADLQPASDAGEVWTCSMHPQIRLPKPGPCPICGMDLIPVEPAAAPAAQAAGTSPLYACAMFCLPPQPNPGKCRICGMDMVEVPADEQPAGGEPAGRSLSLSPAAQKLAEIQTAPVARRFVTAEIRMVGKIDYDETRLGHITAWVPGRLERLFVDYTGIPVSQGDHLVYLYSPELAAAQTELLQALERARTVGPEGSLAHSRARDWLNDIRDKFRLWGLTPEQIQEIEQRGTPSDSMTIYAPMGGIVIDKSAVEGMYVNVGTRIYTIADLTRVWIKLNAYESDLQWLRYGQRVEFQTEAYPGERFAGRIAFIDPVLDARTRTVNVRVNADNPHGRLKPEMFVRAVVHSKLAAGGRVVDAELAGKWISPMHPEVVKDEPGPCDVCGMPLVRAETLGFVSVETGDAAAPLVVPASAPLRTGKRALVYVAAPNEPGRFEGREVILGPRAGDDYIVREGLAEGEAVVVNGAFKIDSAMQILARPSMMNPARTVSNATGESTIGSAEPPAEEPGPATEAIAVPPEFTIRLGPLYDAYSEIQAALSQDDLAAARTAGGRLQAAIASVDATALTDSAGDLWAKERSQLAGSATVVADAPALEPARAAFALLSDGLIPVAKRFGIAGSAMRRFRCPMAFDGRGANWVQTAAQPENPYFGSAMFRCGTLTETIMPRGDATHDGDGDGQR